MPKRHPFKVLVQHPSLVKADCLLKTSSLLLRIILKDFYYFLSSFDFHTFLNRHTKGAILWPVIYIQGWQIFYSMKPRPI